MSEFSDLIAHSHLDDAYAKLPDHREYTAKIVVPVPYKSPTGLPVILIACPCGTQWEVESEGEGEDTKETATCPGCGKRVRIESRKVETKRRGDKMHFEIEQDALVEGLSRVIPITQKRTTLPILSHVLIEAKESKLVLIATDLEVGLKMIYDCAVKEDGSLTVPSKKIYEIIRELRSGPITVEVIENSRIKIIAGQSTFELAGMDAADYPAWAALDDVIFAPVQAADLLYMIDKTLFASSNDEARYNLNGVLFEEEEDQTRLVATDGHRLASISRSLGMTLQSKLIVPKKGLLELRRILEGVKGEISIGFEQKNVVIRTDRFVMTVRLIEGEYPDYRKVIPSGTGRLIKTDRAQLLQTTKRVAILTSERNKGVNVNVTTNLMELTATHPDLGTARDVIDVDYSGDEFTLIINAAYLIEALNVVDSDTITLEYIHKDAPLIIRPNPVKDYFNLVMPMRK